MNWFTTRYHTAEAEENEGKEDMVTEFSAPACTLAGLSSAVTTKGSLVSRLSEEHTLPIRTMALYSPRRNGNDSAATNLRIVSAGDDRTIRVWDTVTRKRLRTIKGGNSASIRVVIVHEEYDSIHGGRRHGNGTGTFIVTGNDCGVVVVYKLSTGSVILTIKAHNKSVNAISICKTTNYPLCNVHDSDSDSNGGVGDPNDDIDLNNRPEKPIMVTVSDDASAVVWDFWSGVKLRVLDQTLGGHSAPITALAVYAPGWPGTGGPVAVTAGYDKQIIVWSLKYGTVVQQFGRDELEVNGDGCDVCDGDGNGGGGGHDDGDVGQMQTAVSCMCLYVEPPTTTAMLAYGSGATSSYGGGKNSSTTTSTSTSTGSNSSNMVSSLAIRSAPLLITGSMDYTASVWDLRSGKCVRVLGVPRPQQQQQQQWVDQFDGQVPAHWVGAVCAES
mmetsp:Transcript_24717/g.41283  ORF Transcript_24717/g.41283 Transcript_24717/m.41283 type:complete len:443 (+) Transcript_24717:45-1373(+)